MRTAWLIGTLSGLLVLAGDPADAAKWSQQYIRQLPDSAFAAVEITPEGKQVRHLPHHDAQGKLDVPHLCNALSRVGQVKWHDPANAGAARQHLREHLDQYDGKVCLPPRGESR